MKKIITGVLWLVALNTYAQPVIKTMLRLPDTGANTSYTNTFGEDNDYSFYPPYFIIHNNGTVTDTVTGLMWQRTDGGEMKIDNASIYCDTLSLGGYTDWRLPSAHESFSILNMQRTNPALDTSVFTYNTAEYWWTANRQANDTNKIWATNAGGGIGNHPRTETISAGGIKKFHVRAVRDVTIPGTVATHFTIQGNGTVTDNLTQLIWQQIPFADTLTWEDALMYADTLSLGGFSDWRLPNIKELQSINDEKLINPSLDKTIFGVTAAKKYWSSTTLPNQTAKAWYLNTQYGITTYDNKTLKHNLICVRGNQVATTVHSFEAPEACIYPNPFLSTIRVQGYTEGEACCVMNSFGQVVYAGLCKEQIDLSFLPDGVYFLFIGKQTIRPKKMVKQSMQ